MTFLYYDDFAIEIPRSHQGFRPGRDPVLGYRYGTGPREVSALGREAAEPDRDLGQAGDFDLTPSRPPASGLTPAPEAARLPLAGEGPQMGAAAAITDRRTTAFPRMAPGGLYDEVGS